MTYSGKKVKNLIISILQKRLSGISLEEENLDDDEAVDVEEEEEAMDVDVVNFNLPSISLKIFQ